MNVEIIRERIEIQKGKKEVKPENKSEDASFNSVIESNPAKRMNLPYYGKLGMMRTVLCDGENYCPKYAKDSTDEDPIMCIGDNMHRVHLKDVDPENATRYEMHCLLLYLDHRLGSDGRRSSSLALMDLTAVYRELPRSHEEMDKKVNWMPYLNEYKKKKKKAGFERERRAFTDALSHLQKFMDDELFNMMKKVDRKYLMEDLWNKAKDRRGQFDFSEKKVFDSLSMEEL